jgi:very-short-patch-repair endonuclease
LGPQYTRFLLDLAKSSTTGQLRHLIQVQFEDRITEAILLELEDHLIGRLENFNQELETLSNSNPNKETIILSDYQKSEMINWYHIFVVHSSQMIMNTKLQNIYFRFLEKIVDFKLQNVLKLDTIDLLKVLEASLSLKNFPKNLSFVFSEILLNSMDEAYTHFLTDGRKLSAGLAMTRSMKRVLSLMDLPVNSYLTALRVEIAKKNEYYLESFLDGGKFNFMQERRRDRDIDSGLQVKTEAVLIELGLKYEKEAFIKGFYVDYLVESNKIVEVLGPFHFVTEKRILSVKDQARFEFLEKSGYDVVQITWDDFPTSAEARRNLFTRKLGLGTK